MGHPTSKKINTTSSTEADVVGLHDNMPAVLWTRYFLQEQGYLLKPSIVHQDNQSSILLENNGRASRGKRTRHLNIRYFFVSDCVKRVHIIMRYCPTDDMIGDFFTKLLQGSKFIRLRNIIMNSSYDEYRPVNMDKILMPTASNKQENMGDDSNTQSKNRYKKSLESQECVGSINDKNSIARKRTYAETVANYVTPRVAPQIAIATHV